MADVANASEALENRRRKLAYAILQCFRHIRYVSHFVEETPSNAWLLLYSCSELLNIPGHNITQHNTTLITTYSYKQFPTWSQWEGFWNDRQTKQQGLR